MKTWRKTEPTLDEHFRCKHCNAEVSSHHTETKKCLFGSKKWERGTPMMVFTHGDHTETASDVLTREEAEKALAAIDFSEDE